MATRRRQGTPQERSPKTDRKAKAEPVDALHDKINQLSISEQQTTQSQEFPFWEPVHLTCVSSLLASETPNLNFRGIYHLAILLLIANHFRLVVENLLKYGILFNVLSLSSSGPQYQLWPCFTCFLGLSVFILIAYLLERAALKNLLSDRAVALLHTVFILSALLVPCAVIWFTQTSATPSLGLLFTATSLCMKLTSYALVNRDLRRAHRRGVALQEPIHPSNLPNPIAYPANITFGNLLYFVAAPTLVYQLNYPRSPSVRLLWLSGKIAQLIFCIGFIRFMVDQYVQPLLLNSVGPLYTKSYGHIIERILKLSLPNLYIWLLIFYSFFHLWLNIVAEVLRFGDRCFYKDWWNASTLDYYWRTWNLPVHNWARRYVYEPLVAYRVPKLAASLVVFFVSAVLHELLISIPLRRIRLWAFAGMLLQVPLVYITRIPKENSWFGNVVFWFSFCVLGQPLMILLYFTY